MHGGQVPDRVALGDAGAVVFCVTSAGVMLVDVEPAPGWRVVRHGPKGFFADRLSAAGGDRAGPPSPQVWGGSPMREGIPPVNVSPPRACPARPSS